MLVVLVVEMLTDVLLILIIVFLLLLKIHFVIKRRSLPIISLIYWRITLDLDSCLSPITDGLRRNVLDLLDQIASLIYVSFRLKVRHVIDVSDLRIIISVISLSTGQLASLALFLSILNV